MNDRIKHIRMRPGLYIGNLGDGSNPDDGLYFLLRSIVENSIKEFSDGYGDQILIEIDNNEVHIRDFGRGIFIGSALDTILNKDSFDREIGQRPRINPPGLYAVNALSVSFYLCSYRNGECSWARFERGEIMEQGRSSTKEKDGTLVRFTPDPDIFKDYTYDKKIVETLINEYTCHNNGLTIVFNGILCK